MAKSRILVADDEQYVCEVVSRWLTAEGYECVQAYDGDTAWELLRTSEFCLLLTDVRMPGMSGMELLEKVRKEMRQVAVVMATAVDDRKMAVSALSLGAYGYLTKPFERDEVFINVVNALERRRLVMASEDYERHLEREIRRHTELIRRREEEIALRLVAASQHRHMETGAHVRRIGLYAAVLARSLGWSPEAVEDIRLAAPMHDVGKIGVPDSILLKPDKLTAMEFEMMKRHTEIGGRMLDGSNIPLLHMARNIALLHHERWDGTGYPRHLKGDGIPEAARMVTIADVYDSLVHTRVYRDALTEDDAVALMSKDCGKHFDPTLFERFIKVLPEFRLIRQQVGEEPLVLPLPT
jgi:putative two-component system response regulator